MTQARKPDSFRRAAAAIKEEWGRGAEPDAGEALARRPELRADKSVVLDLAYEEYCLRFDGGRAPDPEAFCDRFPTYRLSLRRLLAAHQFLAENASLLAETRPVRWPTPGEQLGDFTLLRELGRGAFARVYLASEQSTGGRPVAVKLSPEGAAEARTLGRLAHPNIVPVLSARFEEGAGLTAVCMPYLGAATLTDVLDQAYPTPKSPPPRHANVLGQAIRAAARPDDPAPLTAKQGASDNGLYTDAVVRLAAQIADALAFLHKEGVCHRDLKPSNVLLSPDGRALLLDFNLSADARVAAPRLGGTLPYMAPEQLRALIHPHQADGLDERVDLFSLGVILYELLTGKNPYGAPMAGQSTSKAAAGLLDRQQAGHAPLRAMNRAVDRSLARLVEQCLSFEPSGRPASAATLAAEFRRYLALPTRLLRLAARKPWIVAALGGLLVLAVGGAAVQWVNEEPADVREYHQGRDAFLAGDYGRAEESFAQALKHFSGEPKPRKYYLAHAAAALKQGEAAGTASDPSFSVALADLDEARKQQPDGATTAVMGYCCARLKQHAEAIHWYDKALEGGFSSAGLYNDRGRSHLQLRQLQEANEDLDAALQMDPNLPPALYNRALLGLERPSVNPPPIRDSFLEDMQRAMETGPGSQELYFSAARLFAAAALEGGPGERPGRAKQALSCVLKAVACGMDPDQIQRNLTISAALQTDPDFKTALATPVQSPGPAAASQLVNPAPYVPE